MEDALSGLGAGMRQLLNDKDRQIAELHLALREREQAWRVAEERLRDENARLRALLESTGGPEAIVADSEATAKSLLVIEEQARVIDEQQRRIRMLQRSSRVGHVTSRVGTPAETPLAAHADVVDHNGVALANGTILRTQRRLITPYMTHDVSNVKSSSSAAATTTTRPPITPFNGGLSFVTPRSNGAGDSQMNGQTQSLSNWSAAAATPGDDRLSALLAQQESVRDRLLELREEKLKAMQTYREAQARAKQQQQSGQQQQQQQ